MLRLLACLVLAGLVGGTAALGAPRLAQVPGESPCWAAAEGEAEDVMSPVLRAIEECDDELGISAAQGDRLEALAEAFMRDTLGRRTRLLDAQLALVELLRPDPRDPGRPVDVGAAEARIHEIAALGAAQDVALLHVVEASKAVLTPEQRHRLATLLAGPAPAAAMPALTL